MKTDTKGNPLPPFILSGSVAYAPMVPNPKWEFLRNKLTELCRSGMNEKRAIVKAREMWENPQIERKKHEVYEAKLQQRGNSSTAW